MRNTPLSGLLSAIVILSAVSCANTTTTSSLPEHKVGIVAHRGFWNCEEAGYAQNSVAALRQAQLAGFWGSEFDVQLTADTIVVCEQKILGKPHDEADAHRMLSLLSGQSHDVITGVCLCSKTHEEHFAVTTKVTFKQLSDEEITYYINNYHPLDKAGAYGIQEWIGYIGVTALEGSYFNVMGLPVQRVYEALRKWE